MILVKCLRIIHATEDRGQPVLRDAGKRLKYEKDVGDETHDGVDRDEMVAIVVEFVVLNYDKACNQRTHAYAVERRVNVCAGLFLGRGVRRLQH